jgi:hypothetical protein
MILMLVVASTLAALPHSFILEAPRAATLTMPREGVRDLAVDDLTLRELYSEQLRADQVPGLGLPGVLIGAGGGGALVGGALVLAMMLALSSSSGIGAGLLIGLGLVVGGIGLAVGGAALLVGVVGLVIQLIRRSNHRERQAAIHQRLADIDSGKVQKVGPEGTAEEFEAYDNAYAELRDRRPRFVLPVALMGGGLAAGALGFGAYLLSPANVGMLTIGIASAVAVVAGFVLLAILEPRRDAIDEQLEQLRKTAPREARLERVSAIVPPAVPLGLTFSRAF